MHSTREMIRIIMLYLYVICMCPIVGLDDVCFGSTSCESAPCYEDSVSQALNQQPQSQNENTQGTLIVSDLYIAWSRGSVSCSFHEK